VSAAPIVVVGAGHAALALCASLVEAGQGHRLHLISEEQELAYQRPPLSKSFLKHPGQATQVLREAGWFAAAGVDLVLGDAVQAIDREAGTVALRSGRRLAYAQLVLATGTRARCLPGWPAHARNMHVLRSAQDARRLRDALAGCHSLTVLGGGFIGLEVAATCAALGKRVAVLEAGPRLMGRAVSEALSAHALAVHRAAGIHIELQAAVGAPEWAQDRLLRLPTASGSHEVELLLLAVGAQPNSELAEAAGLRCDNGIVVDAQLRSSDPRILAIGDCARFPWRDGSLRLESIQNAQDQARLAAASLLGQALAPYRPVPWFWSEQGAMRLQMAGLWTPEAQSVCRTGAQAGSLSWFHHVGTRLVCVESVNAPMDHMMARKLLEQGVSPTPAQLADPAVALKSLLPA